MTKFQAWLESQGLEAYAQVFSDNHIDFRVLPELSEADLKELGLSMGHHKRFLAAVAQWATSVADPEHQSDVGHAARITRARGLDTRPVDQRPVRPRQISGRCTPVVKVTVFTATPTYRDP